MNGDAKRTYGCVTTWENEAGEALTLHRIGPTKDGLRSAAAEALAFDPTFRLASYSTPQTIYSDVSGGRLDRTNPDSARTYGKRLPPPLPEAIVLGMIGRLDLLHPRLTRWGRDMRE